MQYSKHKMVMEIVSNVPLGDRQGNTPRRYLNRIQWRENISGISGSDI